MKIYDISLPITEALVVWPGDPPVELTYSAHFDRGDGMNVTRVNMSLHTGTHVDAPLHFVDRGPGVDALSLDALIGPALVVEALEAEELSAAVLESLTIPPGTERVLFHTRNSALWAGGHRDFATDYVSLTADGARWLVDRGIRLAGIDYLSIAAFADLVTPHRILLGAGVIPLEGINLTGIEPGLYQLCCLPILAAGRDGAPARAVLIR